MKNVIYGGTGWIGRALLDYLLKNGYKKEDLIIVSSKKKIINFMGFKFLTLNPEEFKSLKNINCKNYYDLAFLPKIALEKTSKNKFISRTNIIIENSKTFIENNFIEKAFLASSGAVYNLGTKKDSYSIQKSRQENIFIKACEAKEINFNVARIFSLIAPHYKSESNFALTNFLKLAEQGRNLNIKSNIKVERAYLIIDTLFEYIESNAKNEIYDAWNFRADILDIAKVIAKIYSLQVTYPENYLTTKNTDFYASNDSKFQKIYPLKLNQNIINSVIKTTLMNKIEIIDF